jgi:DNA-binding transcriptional regulator YhcF (GntR family)
VNEEPELTMFVRIEQRSTVSITKQIANQIRTQCEEGVLRPGEPLPPARELARQLTVNYHAVCRAYDELAASGAIQIGSGDAPIAARPKVSATRSTPGCGVPLPCEMVSA